MPREDLEMTSLQLMCPERLADHLELHAAREADGCDTDGNGCDGGLDQRTRKEQGRRKEGQWKRRRRSTSVTTKEGRRRMQILWQIRSLNKRQETAGGKNTMSCRMSASVPPPNEKEKAKPKTRKGTQNQREYCKNRRNHQRQELEHGC